MDKKELYCTRLAEFKKLLADSLGVSQVDDSIVFRLVSSKLAELLQSMYFLAYSNGWKECEENNKKLFDRRS